MPRHLVTPTPLAINADKVDGLDATQLAGAQGPPGPAVPSGVVAIQGFSGFIPTIPGSASGYAFVGPTTSVTLTSTQRLTGSASAVLGLSTGGPQAINIGMCYQQGAGTINNFYGANYMAPYATTSRLLMTAPATAFLAAGTYNVGFCVFNNGALALSNNDYVNGWVMVSN